MHKLVHVLDLADEQMYVSKCFVSNTLAHLVSHLDSSQLIISFWRSLLMCRAIAITLWSRCLHLLLCCATAHSFLLLLTCHTQTPALVLTIQLLFSHCHRTACWQLLKSNIIQLLGL